MVGGRDESVIASTSVIGPAFDCVSGSTGYAGILLLVVWGSRRRFVLLIVIARVIAIGRAIVRVSVIGGVSSSAGVNVLVTSIFVFLLGRGLLSAGGCVIWRDRACAGGLWLGCWKLARLTSFRVLP